LDIRIESLREGACRAVGAVAIIDVFRAFTTAAVAFAHGARQIVMVATVEEALALRERGLGKACMGEVGGRAPAGFDFGNSPFELAQAELAGKTIIQRTGAGTQGVVAATQAERLYAASLVTATATARALLAAAAERITLVAMGNNARVRTDEDELCALHLRNLLEGRPGDVDALPGSSSPAARSPTTTTRPVPTCIPAISASPSMSTATTSRSASPWRKGCRSRVPRSPDPLDVRRHMFL